MDEYNNDITDDGLPRHINIYIHAVINLLKQYDRPLTFDEIKRSTNIDLYKNFKVLQSIKKNPKIEAENDTLMFKPLYAIRNAEDLREIVKNLNSEEGVELSKLQDSPVDVMPFIEELKNNNEIFILNDIDGSKIVFYNDLPISSAEEEIKKLWSQIRVPPYHDLIRELNTAGLRNEKVENIKRKIVIKNKKSKRNRRKIKVTNTHVKGLDLSGFNDD